ncbi:hypothetical protein H634G_09833 [Metarhizium anisopliae BRIP 53293]|uniref:Uncharacterized protein n=1 Tax=Metarhizium anisopliae BRIP 53293 TaxID=1291518 RepID=A0A0D9NLG6_METAN|nr:hypothetical protein H634G_09833 [Metarhizium anisopliae BRIP 53293]KJK86827.1 hypothetical protein H633G_09321 [Metarhizium anisopliae BRIP 53284]
MRSVKYHVAYWAVACAGNIIYRASTLTLGVPELLFQALLVPLLVFFVTLVVQGPCPEPWPRLYYIASGALLVSLGSVSRYFYIPSVGVIQPNNFVHCCVAFEVAGTLESVRQDRQDIEPCSVGIFMEAVRRNLGSRRRGIVEFYSVWLSYMLTLMFVTSIFDLFFIRSYGAKATCLSIVGYYLPNNQGPAGSFALLFYVAAAVEDVAETLFLVILKRCGLRRPKVVEGATPLLDPRWGWVCFSCEIAQTSFMMVVMLLSTIFES